MIDGKLVYQLDEDIDATIEAVLLNTVAPNDCLETCKEKFEKCKAQANSNLEIIACKGAYNRCITNCGVKEIG